MRALTRDPKSEAARALAARGADLVPADLDDEDTLATALQGAHGAYCMNFVEHFSAEKETETDGDYCAHCDTALSRSLNPSFQSVAGWLAGSRHAFSVPVEA